MNVTRVLEVLDCIWKSWWTIVAGVCIGLAASTTMLHYTPKTFEAETTIFVVPPQMPEQLVRGTVTDDMSTRLSALREAVISLPYLVKLIEEIYGPISDQEEFDKLVRSIRQRVEVTLMHIDRYQRGGVFRLSYQDSESERAAEVVNTLVKLYIEQNVKFRTNQARDTAATIKELADEVEVELREVESEIAAFKEQHLYDTSEHLNANLQQLSATREELEANGRAIDQERDRLQTLLLQAEQAEWMATAMPDAAQASNSVISEYFELRGELADLRARYREDHPDVRRKKQELDDFLADNADLLPLGEGEDGEELDLQPATSPIRAQIESARRNITRLEAEGLRLQQEIAEYKRRIERTPRVDQELAELTKNHGVLQDSYRSYLEKYEDARAALRMEESQQGERFEIVDKATAPMLPIKPVPWLIYGFGLVGGITLFVGPIVIRYFLVPTISSEAGLKEISDFPVLISINQLPTASVEQERKKRRFRNLAASVLSIATLVAIATWYYYWTVNL
jgi:polysaccharide chain length determinant protein (PEP-CTERM system associated)